ncbi:MAG: phosphoribosylformylglycinamidine synthase I [Candidatus Firestonebacteria bacterium]|nr:phosphoribosylformylglycinamidine synthase I [Candidatus Firestonebacteria bacterium]
MKYTPKALVLITDGVNCNMETYFALSQVGFKPEYVHINQLFSGVKKLVNFQLLALPGGFSYGDDIVSGKILANQLIYRLSDMLLKFIEKDTLILGVCNGFQVLVRTGILPFGAVGKQDTTLVYNDSDRFQCEWISLEVKKSICVFTKGLEDKTILLPIAHAEGKFIIRNDSIYKKLQNAGQIVFQYKDRNPNGSFASIAGICNNTGKILGLMPHPERNFLATQNPNWRRMQGKFIPPGSLIFKNAREYFK